MSRCTTPEAVHDIEAGGDLDGELHRFGHLEGALLAGLVLNAIEQRGPIRPGHNEERPPVGHLVDLMNPHDPIVVQAAQDLGLVDETAADVGLARPVVGQHLDGDLGVE